ncbi:hypothetical protein [Staphylococcus hominis]|uniref:hypothetical protein n=1 Tax=Staphylococcus hominis TaxID=1290 RepID=UPI00321C13C9
MSKGQVYLSDIDFSLFNKEFKEYCFSKLDEFNHFLDLLRESLNSDIKLNKGIESLVKNEDNHNNYIKDVMNNLNNEEIISYLFYVLFLVVTYNDMVLNNDDDKENE